MKVRFIKAWQTYSVGQIIEPYGTLRSWLLQCGYVELVREEQELETAVIEPTENAAVRINPPRRKRGRPRKMP